MNPAAPRAGAATRAPRRTAAAAPSPWKRTARRDGGGAAAHQSKMFMRAMERTQTVSGPSARSTRRRR
jgi:hypothetical protein